MDEKAENDLINARNSIKIKPEPPLDTVCFHAVDIRYPLFEEPTTEEAEEAIEMAIKIKEFVLSRLPVENERSD